MSSDLVNAHEFYAYPIPHDPRVCREARDNYTQDVMLGVVPDVIDAYIGYHAGWGVCATGSTSIPLEDVSREAIRAARPR